MSSKKWLIMLIGTVLLVLCLFAAFNYITDPFGAFGDPVFQWWSYDMTNNPRVAKFSYLEQNHEKYDSYVIGSSGSSSFPVESLNEHFGGSFYNLAMYGSDMQDVEQIGNYLIENYEVKQLVLSVYIQNATQYGLESDPLTGGMHYKADGSAALPYYLRYLFANPQYGFEKVTHYFTNDYLQSGFEVFNAETGSYDKSRRDLENIGSMEEYLSRDAYAIFNDYSFYTGSLTHLEECMAGLSRIKTLCEEKGVKLTVICPPMYSEYMAGYTEEEILTFRRALAQTVDHWDFTIGYASFDPRFFYDETHFRNAIGEQVIEQIASDIRKSDLGSYVAQGTAELEPYAAEAPAVDYTAEVPILLYHHLGEGAVTAERFEEQIAALAAAGYEAVFFEELRAYVAGEGELPEKPIVITFDDGYESNYTIGYPILKKYGMKATIFAIGISMGKDVYKDGEPMYPHFGTEDIAAMADVFDVQSHGYDLHEVEGRDEAPIRQGVLRKEGESEAEYIDYLRADCARMEELLGDAPSVFAYPYGKHDDLSEKILSEEGIYATVTTEPGVNVVIQGLPQCLRSMHRFDIGNDISGPSLLEMIQ